MPKKGKTSENQPFVKGFPAPPPNPTLTLPLVSCLDKIIRLCFCVGMGEEEQSKDGGVAWEPLVNTGNKDEVGPRTAVTQNIRARDFLSLFSFPLLPCLSLGDINYVCLSCLWFRFWHK